MKSEKWPSLPLRRLGTIVGGGTPTPDPEHWGGPIPFVTPPDLRPIVGGVVRSTERTLTSLGAQSGSSIVPSGSVLLSIRAPIGYVARVTDDVAFNQGCRALVPNGHSESQYLVYALLAAAPELESNGRGTTFTELSGAQMAALEVPCPPLAEQRVIADYLDRETAQIDTLIAKQEQLIATLRERYVGLVHQTVCRGVESAQTRSPTGIDWVGYAPTHWGRATLRRVGRLITGSTPTGEPDEVFATDGDVGWASPEDLSRNTTPRRRLSKEGERQLRVSAEAVLICGIGASVGKVGYARGPVATNQQVTALVTSQHPEYWYYALYAARRSLVALAAGNTLPILNNERLSQLQVVIPPVREQVQIARSLDAASARFELLVTKAERFIELAKERRSALITAAVTGQIDVRAA